MAQVFAALIFVVIVGFFFLFLRSGIHTLRRRARNANRDRQERDEPLV